MVALDGNKTIPFDIKRVYYIYGTQSGVSRGFHAHKVLKQVAIVVRGSCRFILDDGTKREDVLLKIQRRELLIESFMWREMHDFSEDCVLMVLADQLYDESDYIRNYDEFISLIKEQ